MNAKTYVKNVLVTEARDLTPVKERLQIERNIRLIHACAGISSEIAEIIQLSNKFEGFPDSQIDRVNLMEECGDILWYIGIASDALNAVETVAGYMPYAASLVKFDDDFVSVIDGAVLNLSEMSGELQDIVIKKIVFYGKNVADGALIELLREIHAHVGCLLEQAGYTIEDARERNIAKLKARYGEKFSEAAALERNLDLERNILENK